MSDRTLAAVLIDFENVFYFLKNHPNLNLNAGDEITDCIVEMIKALKLHLHKTFGELTLSMDAYADFERIDESPLSDLYLLGVETHNVLGTEHKNAADMRLCIDSLDILYNRAEVETFVFVAGDRDYIPVIQYLKKRNKTVRVVGFTGNTKSISGDLLTIVGAEYFIEATQFVSALISKPQDVPPVVVKAGPTSKAIAAAPPVPKPIHPIPSSPLPTIDTEGFMDWEKYEDEALAVLFTHFRDKKEVWLTPYLNKLRAEVADITEWERKQLITRMERKGCFKVVKRTGTPNDYSVLVMDWNHPKIRATYPGQ